MEYKLRLAHYELLIELEQEAIESETIFETLCAKYMTSSYKKNNTYNAIKEIVKTQSNINKNQLTLLNRLMEDTKYEVNDSLIKYVN